MTIQTLSGFAAGEKVTAVKLTQHTKTAMEEAVYYKPFCHLYSSAPQSFGSGAEVTATLNTIVEDTDTMADTAGNRIAIKSAGLYRLNAQLSFANLAGGTYRYGAIMVNASTPKAAATNPAGMGTVVRIHLTVVTRLTVGDTVILRGAHNVGATLNTDTAYGGVYLQAEWISL